MAEIIVIAAVCSGAAYFLLGGEDQSFETIKIGVLGDLDTAVGRPLWQGVVLAAEHLNNEENK